jgi:ABC-type multidrug transport system permease subunit
MVASEAQIRLALKHQEWSEWLSPIGWPIIAHYKNHVHRKMTFNIVLANLFVVPAFWIMAILFFVMLLFPPAFVYFLPSVILYLILGFIETMIRSGVKKRLKEMLSKVHIQPTLDQP